MAAFQTGRAGEFALFDRGRRVANVKAPGDGGGPGAVEVRLLALV